MKYLSIVSTGLILFFLLINDNCLAATHSARTRSQQEEYLRRYGYLQPSSTASDTQLESLQSDSSNSFSSAIRKFQRMAGIRVTGTMNTETIAMMERPRCGVSDHIQEEEGTRKKRYVLEGSSWENHQLTYKFQNYTADMAQYKVASEIAKAFQFWSNVSALSFVRRYYLPADIDIKFVSGNHEHIQAFDGPGGVLAHAFFPQHGGDIHFDEDETWTSGNSTGTTHLLQVAIHEIGHALGLRHSEVSQSIMAPIYKGYQQNLALHSDDIAAIRYLYGRKRN